MSVSSGLQVLVPTEGRWIDPRAIWCQTTLSQVTTHNLKWSSVVCLPLVSVQFFAKLKLALCLLFVFLLVKLSPWVVTVEQSCSDVTAGGERKVRALINDTSLSPVCRLLNCSHQRF